jgi:hypothetical protein
MKAITDFSLSFAQGFGLKASLLRTFSKPSNTGLSAFLMLHPINRLYPVGETRHAAS